MQPAYGRLFAASDDRYGASPTSVITWGFWKRRFGGDPGAIGRTILLDAKPYTIIGILPAGFTYPDRRAQVWTPVYPEAPPEAMHTHSGHNFLVIGRLKRGISVAAAQADLSAISYAERKLTQMGLSSTQPMYAHCSTRKLRM